MQQIKPVMTGREYSVNLFSYENGCKHQADAISDWRLRISDWTFIRADNNLKSAIANLKSHRWQKIYNKKNNVAK